MSAVRHARWFVVDEIQAAPADDDTGAASAYVPNRGGRHGWYRRIDGVWHRVPTVDRLARSSYRRDETLGVPYPVQGDDEFVAALDDAVRIVTEQEATR